MRRLSGCVTARDEREGASCAKPSAPRRVKRPAPAALHPGRCAARGASARGALRAAQSGAVLTLGRRRRKSRGPRAPAAPTRHPPRPWRAKPPPAGGGAAAARGAAATWPKRTACHGPGTFPPRQQHAPSLPSRVTRAAGWPTRKRCALRLRTASARRPFPERKVRSFASAVRCATAAQRLPTLHSATMAMSACAARHAAAAATVALRRRLARFAQTMFAS